MQIFPPNLVYGELVTVALTDPAAGAPVTIAVPTGERWRVLSFTTFLTPSAVAGARYVYAGVVVSGLGTVMLCPASAAIAAAAATTIYGQALSPAYLPAAIPATVFVSLGDCHLAAGETFTLSAVGLLAGDVFTFSRLTYERWRVLS